MAKYTNQDDYLIKLLIIGDLGVGKTSFLLRFTDNNFTTSHQTTIGIDYKQKEMDIDGKVIKLQIWDTAGQERFKTITQSYYKGAMGIILTYDCTNEQSFNNIRNWVQQTKMYASDNVSMVLIGNKCDLLNVRVTTEQGEALAQELGIKFFETSAKTSLNVKNTFRCIVKEIKDQITGEIIGTTGNIWIEKPTKSMGLGRAVGLTDSIRIQNHHKEKKEVRGCCVE